MSARIIWLLCLVYAIAVGVIVGLVDDAPRWLSVLFVLAIPVMWLGGRARSKADDREDDPSHQVT